MSLTSYRAAPPCNKNETVKVLKVWVHVKGFFEKFVRRTVFPLNERVCAALVGVRFPVWGKLLDKRGGVG